MKFRWTKKELKKASDDEMICALLNERMSELNIYAPLYIKLAKVRDNLSKRMDDDKIMGSK